MIAIVTGAASGIGRGVADALAARGDAVLACDVNEEALEAHACARGHRRPRYETRRLDVRNAAAWDAALARAIEAWGQLDVLLNVAGVLAPAWIVDSTPEEVERHLDINAKGVILGTRAAARIMAKQPGGGHIVNMGSLAALAPVPGIALYTASKFAVRGFSLAAAEELRPHGVRVTVVCPDLTRTPMLDVQRDRAEAALSFSGPRILETDEVVRLIVGRVLRDRPLEAILPWSRGFLARLAGFAPGLASWLAPALTKKGLAAQARERERQRAGE